MSKPELIVLLGHENDPGGELSNIAQSRVDHAVALAKLRPEAKLLATGTFGPTFNTSDAPHSHHLRKALLQRDIPAERILPARVSARTLEDAFVVRRVLAEHPEIARVTIVTSSYHMPRASFLFSRVLPDRELEFSDVKTPDCAAELSSENRRFKRERRDWISFPLLARDDNSGETSRKIYETAASDQKAYDQLSYVVIAGAFVTFFAPYLIDASIEDWEKIAGFALSGTVMIVLLAIYLRMAMWANTARQVMYLMELQWGIHGFSYNARHNLPAGNLWSPLRLLSRLRIALPLSCVVALMIAIQIANAVASVGEPGVPRIEAKTAAPTKVR